jgi:hypothetical protein
VFHVKQRRPLPSAMARQDQQQNTGSAAASRNRAA